MSLRLRALTLNIWHREAPWERRRELISCGIAALQPDIVGLQEVLELDTGGVRQSQAQELSELCLGAGLVHRAFACAQEMMPGLAFGNALLSKHPILAQEAIALPGAESGETRSVLFVRVQMPFGEVPVFVTHLNWKLHHGAVRIRQVKRLAELIEERAPVGKTFPPILMGDFNAEPDSDEIRFLRGLACLDGQSVFFADAWTYAGNTTPGFTFDRRNPYAARAHEPPRRIDYIFVRGPDSQWAGEPLETKVVLDAPEDGVWPSDHFGVYTEIRAGQAKGP